MGLSERHQLRAGNTLHQSRSDAHGACHHPVTGQPPTTSPLIPMAPQAPTAFTNKVQNARIKHCKRPHRQPPPTWHCAHSPCTHQLQRRTNTCTNQRQQLHNQRAQLQQHNQRDEMQQLNNAGHHILLFFHSVAGVWHSTCQHSIQLAVPSSRNFYCATSQLQHTPMAITSSPPPGVYSGHCALGACQSGWNVAPLQHCAMLSGVGQQRTPQASSPPSTGCLLDKILFTRHPHPVLCNITVGVEFQHICPGAGAAMAVATGPQSRRCVWWRDEQPPPPHPDDNQLATMTAMQHNSCAPCAPCTPMQRVAPPPPRYLVQLRSTRHCPAPAPGGVLGHAVAGLWPPMAATRQASDARYATARRAEPHLEGRQGCAPVAAPPPSALMPLLLLPPHPRQQGARPARRKRQGRKAPSG
jgi:hypothetical protein